MISILSNNIHKHRTYEKVDSSTVWVTTGVDVTRDTRVLVGEEVVNEEDEGISEDESEVGDTSLDWVTLVSDKDELEDELVDSVDVVSEEVSEPDDVASAGLSPMLDVNPEPSEFVVDDSVPEGDS